MLALLKYSLCKSMPLLKFEISSGEKSMFFRGRSMLGLFLCESCLNIFL